VAAGSQELLDCQGPLAVGSRIDENAILMTAEKHQAG
jgi:hypothetical protein